MLVLSSDRIVNISILFDNTGNRMDYQRTLNSGSACAQSSSSVLKLKAVRIGSTEEWQMYEGLANAR